MKEKKKDENKDSPCSHKKYFMFQQERNMFQGA
jgi:hypothetical protein